MKLRTQVFIKSPAGEVIKGLLSFFAVSFLFMLHERACSPHLATAAVKRSLSGIGLRPNTLCTAYCRAFILRISRLFDHVVKINMFRMSTSFTAHDSNYGMCHVIHLRN